MKKLTSVFLSVLFLLSTLTLSVYAESNQLILGKSSEISFLTDEVAIYTFKPTQAGNYKITIEGGTKSLVTAEIYRNGHSNKTLDEGFVATTDKEKYIGFGVINLNSIMASLNTEKTELMYMNARAGSEIKLKLSDMSSFATDIWDDYGMEDLIECFTPSSVKVTVEAVDLTPIKPGHKPHISHRDVFEFVPDHSGKYRFTSELSDGAIPELTICDYTGCIATSEVFETSSAETDLNFDVTVDLQAGETYLIHCDNNAVNTETNESIGAFSVDVEPLDQSCISDITYNKTFDTHNTFRVTVDGRPAMIQFIEPDNGTRTYFRENKNVSIRSYDANGNEVNPLDRTATYEIWDIYSNMSTYVEIKARAKYFYGYFYRWEKSTYKFTVELLEKTVDAGIRSILPSATSGGKGPVSTTVVTGPDAQGIQFRMPNGTTTTYYSSNAVVLENGDLEFNGKAWMNESGINKIKVFIRSENRWIESGVLEYTVE